MHKDLLEINTIKEYINNKKVDWTKHCLNRMNQREISIKDVKNAIKETYKEFFIKMMPIFITVIVFCFIKWIPISSFGTVMLWGIILIAIYNFIITSTLLKIRAKE